MVLLGLDLEESFKKIEELLKNDWILVMGEIECIQKLEFTIYTPGTERNKDFIVIFLPKLLQIVLVRKTKELQEYLKLPEEIFKNMLGVGFHAHEEADYEIYCTTEILGAEENKKDEAISIIISKIKELTSIRI